MAERDFFGVKQDDKTGFWIIKLHKMNNKGATWLKKHPFKIKLQAAVIRDSEIRRWKLDQEMPGNKLNFSDSVFATKLKKIEGQMTPFGKNK